MSPKGSSGGLSLCVGGNEGQEGGHAGCGVNDCHNIVSVLRDIRKNHGHVSKALVPEQPGQRLPFPLFSFMACVCTFSFTTSCLPHASLQLVPLSASPLPVPKLLSMELHSYIKASSVLFSGKTFELPELLVSTSRITWQLIQ